MKTTLYLGTDPTYFPEEGHVIHFPVIQVVPRPISDHELKRAFDDLEDYTHILFTSKNAVQVFFRRLADLKIDKKSLSLKTLVAIGRVTASYLKNEGLEPSIVAQEETQEGLIKELSGLNLDDAYIFFPRSSLSRRVLEDFLRKQMVRYQTCTLYDTLPRAVKRLPDLSQVEEIVFTSPSTVEAFYEIFGFFPEDKKLVVIGPITEEALREKIRNLSLK